MKFAYGDLISGDSIYVDGIGHLRSPRLNELKPTQGIGDWRYNFYLNLLTWEKEDYLKYFGLMFGKRATILNKNKLSVFDIVALIDSTRELLLDAMAFFIDETITWDKGKRVFRTYSKGNDDQIGEINRDNFEEVRDMMLQMNYINVGKSANPIKHSSSTSKGLWERAQKYLKDESKKTKADKSTSFGNVISKICAANIGYTLLNIYDLTVFQLYDQFFQYGYLRGMNLSEMIFSNHGGKDFDSRSWLKPIINI